jgi:hypothetical protein
MGGQKRNAENKSAVQIDPDSNTEYVYLGQK